ncbi:MAG TPA: hypothetical protein DCG47_01870 [Spirochaetaceae bacterium]|jgi:hypothetical protein|nr:hypothetical protein [Spirochaetaceae bacterium]
MRIVFDYNGHIQGLPTAASAASGRENVLVVRLAAGEQPKGGAAIEAKATGGLPAQARWKTSDEAIARDRAVRGHEAAHLSALGPYAASPAIFATASAPDGQRLAISAKIKVDLSEVPGNPEATLQKARTILNAANAPVDPSAADLRMVARAYALMQQAKEDIDEARYA